MKITKTNIAAKKIGFSKLAELRPSPCVLVCRCGSHTICNFTAHQNVKLMIQGIKLDDIIMNDGTVVKDYKNFMPRVMCNQPNTVCLLNECPSCPCVEL